MKKIPLIVSLSTLGFTGYIAAPGTCATLVTLPVMLGLRFLIGDDFWYGVVVAIFAFASIKIISRALAYFAPRPDPSEIVLDEFVGCLVTFVAVPLTWYTVFAGFVLFRFFDITKWFGVRSVERLSGGLGVVADDVLAAVWSNAILQLALFAWSNWV